MPLSPKARARLRQSALFPLVAAVLALAAIVAAGSAIAGALGSNPSPPPPISLQGLAQQLTKAQAPQALSGRFTLTNRLLPAQQHDAGGDQGSSPLLGGGSGRFWYQAPDKLHVELQGSSGSGDVQLTRNGSTVWLYDGTAHTAQRINLPAKPAGPDADAGKAHKPPTPQQIADGITHLEQHWNVTGPTPTTQGNRSAYGLSLAPHDAGSLLAQVAGALDSTTGLPLRFDVYAVGVKDPVLSIAVTQLSTSSDQSVFDFTPPAGTKVSTTTLNSKRHPGAFVAEHKGHRKHAHASNLSVPAAQQLAGFPLAAPATAAGRSLTGVDAGAGTALLHYGDGPGTIVVLERKADKPASAEPAPAGDKGGDRRSGLPTVGLPGGVTAHELSTPLGTIVTWRHGNVSFVVAGSRPSSEVLGVAQAVASS